MLAPSLSRRALLLAAGAWLLGRAPGEAAASATTPVEDWSATTVGAKGVPPGWRTYETPGGHPAYDFTVVEDAGHRALRMRSSGYNLFVCGLASTEALVLLEKHIVGLRLG